MDISDSTSTDANSSHRDELEQKEKDLAMDSKDTSDDSGVAESDEAEIMEYLSGYQLYMVVVATSLVGFLYTLDVTIVSTVSYEIPQRKDTLSVLLTSSFERLFPS